MLLTPWLQNLRNRLRRPAPHFRVRKQFSPVITIAAQVEQLEDRKLLSGVVTTTADSGTGSLRQAILDADANTGPQTITFAIPGGPATIDLASALPDLTGTITIQGPGAANVTVEPSIVSGTPQFSLFTVDSGATADISGLTIANGDSAFAGGGIINNGTLSIESSTLSNNSTAYFGGGIYNAGMLTVTGSTLSDDSATSTLHSHGGGIFNASGCTLTVTDSTLSGNSAATGGGIMNYGMATVTNSSLSGNSAIYGGGILNKGAAGMVTIADSVISGNSATRGGGLWNDATATVTDSTLSGNSATQYGGGVWNVYGGTLSVSGGAVSDNSATLFGGGIVNKGTLTTLTMVGSTLSGNSATNNGGGIVNYGAATVTNSSLSGNSATTGSGGGIMNFGSATVAGSMISDNSATYGGGVRSDGTLTVTDTTLSGNIAANRGGGIMNYGAAAITNTTLSGNSANDGGGIISKGTLTVQSSTLSNNSAVDSGGGIESFGTATVGGSTLSGNSSGSGGGIATFGTATVTDSTLSENNAGNSGGGIWNQGTLTSIGSTLSGNTATGSGGGIFNNYSGTLLLSSTTLSGNSAASGGGIFNVGQLGFGFPPGSIAVSGDYLQTASGQLAIQVGGTTPGAQYDQVDVAANVDLGGALDVSFTNGFTSTAGETFTIIKNDGSNPVSGTFAGLAQGAFITVGGRQFQISYTGGDGNDVTLTDVGLSDITPANTINTVEGNSTANVVLATFLDGNPADQPSDFTAAVNWNGTLIGSPIVSVQLVSQVANVSTWEVIGSAVYAEKGMNPVTVSVSDVDGSGFTSTQTTISVADAPLVDTTIASTIKATVGISTGTVVLATFTDGDPYASSGDYTTTVDFGGPVTGTPSASIQLVSRSATVSTWQVVGSVTYAAAGSFPITVTVNDADGSNVTANETTVSVASNAAILLLDPTGKGALTDSGNGKIIVGGNGDIVVASQNAAAVSVSGNGTVTASQLDLESSTGTQTSGNGKIGGVINRGVASSEAVDPLAGLAAPTAPSTQFAAANISGNTVVTLQPGTYNGGIHVSGDAQVTLAAGIYYLNGGGFSATGNAIVTGSGILIYNAPQSLADVINISGSASVTLSAATSGTYQGIVLFQSRTSAAPITISGNASLILTGTLYAPAATVYVSGNGLLELLTAAAELIAADMNVSGNGVVKVDA